MLSKHTVTACTAVVAGLLLVGSLVAPVGGTNVQQGDDYPDDCDEAPIVESTGVVKGVIDSPEDRDTIKIEIPEKGNYVTVGPVVPQTEHYMTFGHEAESQFSLYNATGEVGITSTGEGVVHPRNYHGNGTWEIWSETSDQPIVVCIEISESDSEEANIPYEYAIRFAAANPEPVTIAEEIDRLQQMLDEKNETIAQLRNNSTTTSA